MRGPLLVACGLALLLASPSLAQDRETAELIRRLERVAAQLEGKGRGDVAGRLIEQSLRDLRKIDTPGEPNLEAVERAIERGSLWLSDRQSKDGSFPDASGSGPGPGDSLGVTALATLALLKAGVPPQDPGIVRAFEFLYDQPLRRTYGVSLLVLAIEARFAPPADELKRQEKRRTYARVARRQFHRRARKLDKAKLASCTNWLIRSRGEAVWGYPGGGHGGQDHSNTQYAVMALKSARRLGCSVPAEVFAGIADHFLDEQQAEGPAVDRFRIPAADGPILDEASPDRRRRAVTRTREQRATEVRPMRARGWSYLPRDAQPPGGNPMAGHHSSTGSMTASGIAALVIAKSELERSPVLWKKRRDRVDQGIRDGCAWLSHEFRVDTNPSETLGPRAWTYYYLYGLQRAGTVAGTYRLGGRDWWDEGALYLLGQQTQPGCWPGRQPATKQTNTCFALLFLARATTPLVPLPPKRVATQTGRR